MSKIFLSVYFQKLVGVRVVVFAKVQTPRTRNLIFESNISLLVVVVEILDVEVVTVVDFCTNVEVVSVVDFCINVVVAKGQS